MKVILMSPHGVALLVKDSDVPVAIHPPGVVLLQRAPDKFRLAIKDLLLQSTIQITL